MEIEKILIILALLSPLIILGILGTTMINFENPIVEYTKYSISYIEISHEEGGKNPFTVSTNTWKIIKIKNRLGDIPITKIKFMFSSGMDKFMFKAYGNVTTIILDRNRYEIDLRKQFRILGKEGDVLEIEIQLLSEFYKEVTITLQGGVI